jgi:hypothetical protein
MTAGTVFLSIALLTAFNVNRVRTAASVGVNKDASCVCIVKKPSLKEEYIVFFKKQGQAPVGP